MWRSEVFRCNAAGQVQTVLLEIIPLDGHSAVPSRSSQLDAAESRHIPDLYADLLAPSGSSALCVTGEVMALFIFEY